MECICIVLYLQAEDGIRNAQESRGHGDEYKKQPIRDCMASSIPIVVICGQVPTAAIGTDGFQEAPVTNIMGNCAKHVFLVTEPERLEARPFYISDAADESNGSHSRPLQTCKKYITHHSY